MPHGALVRAYAGGLDPNLDLNTQFTASSSTVPSTAPALPTGWTFEGDWDTNTGAALSSPNSLVCNDLASVRMGTFDTVAPHADTIVEAAFLSGDFSTSTSLESFIVSRMSSQTYAGSSGYLAGFYGGTSETKGLHLLKRVTGTNTDVATVAFTPTINVWYLTTHTIVGNDHTVRVQRLSDNQYLTSGGTFQAGATDAIAYTDSSSPITAAGYVGVVAYCAGTLRFFRIDNFDAEMTPKRGVQALPRGHG